ncbi:hypothetical protein [Streptomyces sp. ISL-11]|uniref:hypothetical protein n=1 Tax=Streptomyces sp. ISL-11 TaxID=2819174 RepID=UPI001BEA3B90|nr:hypothetical protein [Streptomyces sp. ISL-11]MBT2384203.1 hypothetical protein [Streptomyces sp. ISL-11]
MRFPFRRTAASLFAAGALAGAMGPAALAAPAGPRQAPRQAECRTRVHGSHATADCFNGHSDPDRVQLHIECDRWWDPDMDTAPATVGPARYVSLTQRCWLGIHHAWVTHTPG